MTETPILELIPQRPPFVLVDKLTFFEGKIAKTQFSIPANHIMLSDDNTLSAGGLIENIAQTCAARIGYINKFLESKTIKIGVIGSIKNLTINYFPKVGDIITTTVEETFSGMLNMTMLNAKIECEGAIIAEGEIKVALTDKESN
ncbi:MAG: pseudouridylate synthase [Bacteroidales bacterium]|nr:pseudouridylate synthase [Bacteroidales bacterium]